MTVKTNSRDISDNQIKAGHSQIHTLLINLKVCSVMTHGRKTPDVIRTFIYVFKSVLKDWAVTYPKCSESIDCGNDLLYNI